MPDDVMSVINSISLRTISLVFFGISGICFAREGTITCEPCDGAGQGKHIVFICGDWKAPAFGGGKFKKGLKPDDFAVKAEIVQAGFFTPARTGKMWDTWIYHHHGKYYMYYLAGSGGHWGGHELAISEDRVHWAEHGVMIKPRPGVTWMGTGRIQKSPDFAKTQKWVIDYSEWFGNKQDIRVHVIERNFKST